ncbi:SDR family NAD(P)-dependent oxidoreductase [Chlorogloeopsis sp. ULAP01]|uniref:SDR family NAD(P)-dependent oxidoreductase n=1 Tax=Chlorogloeopsis sp. ULAP01 TaxID=3056483 RepID=UPI0025AA87B2|nr:SDR family NAD(P)-dependent oxidoreductase [Chlorogloeopsis sp. ULAP01]MDM9379465.1 SDR family NAD(P)-dependent oxidoreductase [Chlorogloeopsis sp. ULAP01]
MTKSTKGAILITGTSAGIGRATALLLDQKGYQVFTGVRTEKDAESLKQEASGMLTPIILDITNQAQIQAASEFVSLAVGEQGLFGLVNNPCGITYGPLECVPIEDVRLNFEVGIIGHIAVTQAFLPMLRKAKGRIINISASCGKIALPYFGLLSASKFALESFTDSLRTELCSSGIEVSSILSGAFKTDIYKKVKESYEITYANMSPETKALYDKYCRTDLQEIKHGNHNGLPCEIFADVILKVLEARKSKRQYFISSSFLGMLEEQLFYLAKRLLSCSTFNLHNMGRQDVCPTRV